jgi:hypothetical protein
VLQEIVGKATYSCEEQELGLTQRSLTTALELATAIASRPTLEKMALAVGMGVTFIEQQLVGHSTASTVFAAAGELSHRFVGRPLAIDDRIRVPALIADAGARSKPFMLTAIMDDATETVVDLLWLQDLLAANSNLKVALLVNTAQISINFSSHFLDRILGHPCFRGLAAQLGGRFEIVRMYCPFISFQTEFLPTEAKNAIARSDLVFVKGANFFETCQIPEKDSIHAFVVYGPISRTYSGFNDYEGVFVWLPAGTPGYVHAQSPSGILTLKHIHSRRDELLPTTHVSATSSA